MALCGFLSSLENEAMKKSLLFASEKGCSEQVTAYLISYPVSARHLARLRLSTDSCEELLATLKIMHSFECEREQRRARNISHH